MPAKRLDLACTCIPYRYYASERYCREEVIFEGILGLSDFVRFEIYSIASLTDVENTIYMRQ